MLLFGFMDNQQEILLELAFAVRSLLLNNQEFLSIQIDQHITIMISIANGTLKDLLILFIALIERS
jgi:hypothetical protein